MNHFIKNESKFEMITIPEDKNAYIYGGLLSLFVLLALCLPVYFLFIH